MEVLAVSTGLKFINTKIYNDRFFQGGPTPPSHRRP